MKAQFTILVFICFALVSCNKGDNNSNGTALYPKDTGCVSDCVGKECGDDGCGRDSCGICDENPGSFCNEDFQCDCKPDCEERECGGDGCGGRCQNQHCNEGFSCSYNGQCVCETIVCENVCCPTVDDICYDGQCCTPDAEGRICGYDGCGNFFGDCKDGKICMKTECVEEVGLADTPWPMYMHDPQHTCRSPYVGPENPEVKWMTENRFSYSGPVITKDNYLMIGQGRGVDMFSQEKLYGDLKWSGTFYDAGNLNHSTIAIDKSGTYYISDCEVKLFSFKPLFPPPEMKAHIRWQRRGLSSPVIGKDGTIYVNGDGKLMAINPDGTRKWFNGNTYASQGCSPIEYGGDTIYSSPTLSHDEKILYFDVWKGNIDCGLGAIETDTGIILWETNWLCPITSTPVVDDNGNIYITNSGYNHNNRNGLAAFSPDGELLWKVITNEDSKYPPFSSPALGPDGTIYFGSQEPWAIYAVNPDGTVKWELENYTFEGPPAIDANGVLYTSNMAVNPDGTIKWELDIPNNPGIRSMPTIIGSDGTVFGFVKDENYYGEFNLIAIGELEKI